MATGLQTLLWGIALVALALGIVGAIYRGYWGAEHDCQSWVNGHGYAVLHNDWWAKDRVAWQFAIFAAGTLPAAGMIAYVRRNPSF
jgi:hypothetical protein